MQATIKTRAAFRTAYMRPVLDYALVLDSLDAAASTLTLLGGDLPRELAGGFVYLADTLFLISSVSPGEGETALLLSSPADCFTRPRPYIPPPAGSSVGAFVARELAEGWRDEPDGVYAMPYLRISTGDVTPFVPPTVDENGYYILADYLRAVRRSAGVETVFSPEGDALSVLISAAAPGSHTLLAGDGHTALKSSTYSRTAVAKVTTVQPVDTGETDENGEKIFAPVSTDWFLAPDGSVSSQAPQERVQGEWAVVTVSAKNDAQAAAVAVFSKNSETHKVEFWTDFRPRVRDPFRLRLPSGAVFSGEIAAVTRSPVERRGPWQAGNLATTLTDKVRRAGSSAAGRGSASAQLYAVGDVFITTRAGDPADLLGYGAWDRIQGRFLFAADASRPVNSRGGAASHTITMEELPADVSIPDTSRIYAQSEGAVSGSGSFRVRSYDLPLKTNPLGEGKSFSLLPPYVALYVWVRKA